MDRGGIFLNKEGKRELLKLASSKQIKKDFTRLRKNRNLSSAGAGYSKGDRYIKFLGFCDNFINSEQKLFLEK